MKDKLQKITRTFARSIIQPVMFMAVTGLFDFSCRCYEA